MHHKVPGVSWTGFYMLRDDELVVDVRVPVGRVLPERNRLFPALEALALMPQMSQKVVTSVNAGFQGPAQVGKTIDFVCNDRHQGIEILSLNSFGKVFKWQKKKMIRRCLLNCWRKSSDW